MKTLSDTCRIVLMTPCGPVELALPSMAPLCDLLPTLVHHAVAAAGPGRTNAGDAWVLQRLGESPLDQERTIAELNVRDGETLHLRLRDDALPAVHFDDLIDGVATGMRRRRDHWRDWMTRRALLALAGIGLGAGLVVLALTGPVVARGATAAGIAALLLLGGVVAARAFGEVVAGALLGAAAAPYAALSGLLLVTAPLPPSLAAPNVFAAAAAAGLTAMLAAGAVGVARAAFGAGVAMCGAVVAGGLLLVLADWRPWQAAAVIAVAATSASTIIPRMAFWLAKLRLPTLPTGPDDLAADVEPYAVARLLDRTAAADRYMTAMFAAAGAVVAVALSMLAQVRDGTAIALAMTICGVLLLRARAMTSAWQRISALCPALLGLVVLTLQFAANPVWPLRLCWLAVLLAAAGAALVAARQLPGRRLVPYWGRLGDIAEYAVAIAMLPLTLTLLGVLGWARSLAG